MTTVWLAPIPPHQTSPLRYWRITLPATSAKSSAKATSSAGTSMANKTLDLTTAAFG